MAWERPVLDLPAIIAGESFATGVGYQSTGQFLFVKMDPAHADNTVVKITSHRDRPVGVSQGNSLSGQALQVRAIGVSKIVAAENLVAGQVVGPDNNGKAIHKNETSTGADYGDFVAGIVMEQAVAGALATVLLLSPYRI